LLAEKTEETAKGTQQQVQELRDRLEEVTMERDQAVEVGENLRKEAINTKNEM
jgi:chromosome segregation ATPase